MAIAKVKVKTAQPEKMVTEGRYAAQSRLALETWLRA